MLTGSAERGIRTRRGSFSKAERTPSVVRSEREVWYRTEEAISAFCTPDSGEGKGARQDWSDDERGKGGGKVRDRKEETDRHGRAR